jgi:DnaJ homologue, subfamily C, member 28, conserved domain
MTERKPPGTSFASWIDRQIAEAQERGAFDNLPGAGQPLPRRDEDAGQAWLRDYMRREGVSSDDLLPTPLRLRKEAERLADSVPGLRSEQEVREAVADLNDRILQWRRIPLGPPVFLPLIDEDALVARWRGARPAPASEPSPAPADHGAAASPALRRRWWHRLTRRAV